jgi:protein TonB
MRGVLILIFTSFVCLAAYGQTDSLASDTTEKVVEFITVESPARFPGGEEAFMQFINENLEYPKEAIENDVMGEVWIQFDIDKHGNVENVEVVKSEIVKMETEITKRGVFKRKKITEKEEKVEGYDYCLGTCAANLISNSPQWEPAMQRNKPVRMRYRVPIRYRIY